MNGFTSIFIIFFFYDVWVDFSLGFKASFVVDLQEFQGNGLNVEILCVKGKIYVWFELIIDFWVEISIELQFCMVYGFYL